MNVTLCNARKNVQPNVFPSEDKCFVCAIFVIDHFHEATKMCERKIVNFKSSIRRILKLKRKNLFSIVSRLRRLLKIKFNMKNIGAFCWFFFFSFSIVINPLFSFFFNFYFSFDFFHFFLNSVTNIIYSFFWGSFHLQI